MKRDIFFLHNDMILWSNGKRFEIWQEVKFQIQDCLLHSSRLYCTNKKGKILVWKGKYWNQAKIPTNWKHPIAMMIKKFTCNHSCVFNYCNLTYFVNEFGNLHLDDRKYKTIQRFKTNYVSDNARNLIKYHNGWIYSFYNFEKLKMQETQIETFTICPFKNKIENVAIILDNLYIFFKNNLFMIYNPQTDIWNTDLQIIKDI